MRLCRRALGSVSENGLLPLLQQKSESFDCVAPLGVEVQERAGAGCAARECQRGR